MSKQEYIKYAVLGKIYSKTIFEAALIFYHAGVPLNDARFYLKTLEGKIK